MSNEQSATPRTDAFTRTIFSGDGTENDASWDELKDLACQLERELCDTKEQLRETEIREQDAITDRDDLGRELAALKQSILDMSHPNIASVLGELAEARKDTARATTWRPISELDRTKMQFVLVNCGENFPSGEVRLMLWNPYGNKFENAPDSYSEVTQWMPIPGTAMQEATK